jgi:hypothetical protein
MGPLLFFSKIARFVLLKTFQAARVCVVGLPQKRLYLRRLPQGQGALRTGSFGVVALVR